MKTIRTTYNPFHLLTIIIVSIAFAGCSIDVKDVAIAQQADTIYIGQLQNGKREGLGELSYNGRIIYSGQWHNNLRQGQGWATDSIGRKIFAEWDNDTIVKGTRHDSTGVYHGEFNHQLEAHGHGIYNDDQGTFYEGQWKTDHRHGFGFSSQKKLFRVGEWNKDVYMGERLSYTSERIYGIDISKHQHVKGKKKYSIDWSRLRITHLGRLSKKNISGNVDYKVSFIFIKSTEGTTIVNPYYRSDYAAARAHGYPVGSYHFFSHRTSGAAQAATFLRNTQFRTGDLPPVLDLEPYPSQVEKMGGPIAMWSKVRNWLHIVEKRTGMRPILYVNQLFINRYFDLAPDIKHNYPVWIARYGEYKPDVKLWIWQLAPDGRVAGIHGEVDINVFNGYNAEFKQWLQTVRRP